MQIHLRDSERKLAYSLHYGNAQRPLARILPDSWPGMWRIVWPDGRLTDMTNLTRAKDAAAAIAERGPPLRNGRRLRWQLIGAVEEAARASPDAPTPAAINAATNGVGSPMGRAAP